MLWLEHSVHVGVVVEDGHFIKDLENHGKDSDVGGHWKYSNRRMIAFYLEFKNIVLADLWRINL